MAFFITKTNTDSGEVVYYLGQSSGGHSWYSQPINIKEYATRKLAEEDAAKLPYEGNETISVTDTI